MDARFRPAIFAAPVLLAGLAVAFATTPAPPATSPVAALPSLPAQLAQPPAEHTPPASARLDPVPLQTARRTILRQVANHAFPGAALAVGRGSDVAMETGIGRITWSGESVDPETTVYDLASLTKAVATTTAVMLLVEDGKLELDAPVRRYLPQFRGGAKNRVTVRQLLTHTSGLPAWADIWSTSPEGALARAIHTPLERAPGKRAEYSDIGFVVLWAAAERAAGEPLPALLRRRVWRPLGMDHTRFLPGEGCAVCAPTLRLADGAVIRGVVHDPIARQLGGVAGNAGLFSTAHDLGRFAAMLANGGELDGGRVLKSSTIERFTHRQPGAGTRALGWDTRRERDSIVAGMSARAFGHLGFTGTSLWVDPESGTWAVLLTNRTYDPRGPNRIMALRRSVYAQVARAALKMGE